ncbi:hypothetical protein Bbelb_349040 [Branchiostoma belcheri]|nr:hypothetical protein Bbelb_349040 [Branchiostoma belcheri]
MREEVEIGLGDGRAGYHSQEGAGTTRLMGTPPPSRSLQLLSPIQPHIITHFLHLITSTCARHVPTGALLGQPGFNTRAWPGQEGEGNCQHGACGGEGLSSCTPTSGGTGRQFVPRETIR